MDVRSHQQLSRMNKSEYKTARMEKRLIYKGFKEASGKVYTVITYIDKNKYVIEI